MSRNKRCIYCGRSWGISVLQDIPDEGYECPRCAGKRKRAQQRQLQGPIRKIS